MNTPIDSRKTVADDLRRSQTFLAETQRLSHTGSFSWHPDSGDIYWSEEVYRIYDLPEHTKPSMALARERVHPEDRAYFDQVAHDAVASQQDFTFEHRILLPGGQVKYGRIACHAIHDAHGKFVEYIGAIMDVSKDRMAQDQLEQALRAMYLLKEKSRLALDSIPGMVWSSTPDGYVSYLNQRWLDFTGFSLEQAVGRGWNAAIHPDDLPALAAYWESVLASRTEGEVKARLRRFDGVYRWFLFRVVPVLRADGEIEEWFAQTTDIDDLKRTEARLAGEAHVLKIAARGTPLAAVLEALCYLVEENFADRLCGIILVDPSGTKLVHGAAPSLPSSYNQAIHGRPVTVDSGPCAMAASLGVPVITPDVLEETRWRENAWRELALAHGLRACWSIPICASTGKVLGTFAIYSHAPGVPGQALSDMIDHFAHLASIVIERIYAVEALHASQHIALGQYHALRNALDALAQESEPDKILQHVLCTMNQQLGSHSCSLWSKVENTGYMNFAFAFENGEVITDADPILSTLSQSLKIEDVWPWPEVFRTGKPYLLKDVAKDSIFPWQQHVLELGIKSILIVPMLVKGQVEGVIGIRFSQQRDFSEVDLELAQALTNQLSLALQLMRLSRISQESAVMAERNRMARDIHDTLAQGFAGVVVQLEAAADANARGLYNEAEHHLGRVSELARECLQEARRSAHALRPQVLDVKSLCEALHEMQQTMTQDTPVHTEFTQAGVPRDLPPAWEENMLRIGQEILANCLRHARASHFSTHVLFTAQDVRMRFRDDGRGFDPELRSDGFGLRGIQERVAGMAGKFALRSQPGDGTTIEIELPLSS
jgi:PAS domain S-box-containing protein